MMVLFIASGVLLVAQGILCDITTNVETPAPLPQLPPEEYPGFFKFLELCSKKFTRECGKKTYFVIYFGNVTTNDGCCNDLVTKVGKPCYDGLLRFTLKSNTFKDNVSHIMARAAQTWSKCASIPYIPSSI